MSDNNLNKLKAILREMFQLDQADLDFGIYRIMNQKRDEIEQFLDRDLLPQVKTVFAGFQGDDQSSVRDEMDKLKKTLDDAGVVAETSPKYQALQAKLSASVDVSALENEVFSQLTNFFRRYYQGGDFLSLRRYKAGVYAIPYEGEEVKLHWANADQYYIKSSENFRDYTFKLPSGKRAHFKLVDASTEQNNKKEQAGKERRFILVEDTPLVVDNGELFIRFEYRVVDEGKSQKELNGEAVKVFFTAESAEIRRVNQEERLVESKSLGGNQNQESDTSSVNSFGENQNPQSIKDVDSGFNPDFDFLASGFPLRNSASSAVNDLSDWKRELSALAPTEKNTKRTLLEKHLNDYTAKYSFDYFIHKDLGGFMRRELDFFIKNEILFIDDLDADHVKATISKVKVIKEIGHKVIAFLEQLENFQKKLWLKKKFVVETGYCCTLDKVPEDLYPAVIANTAQVEEWKLLFAIQDIEGDLHTPKYTDPLTVEFLKANPFLVIDTVFFEREFTENLLASFDNLDESSNGLIVHGENFQALNLLFERYQGQVKCTYTDPPYNTGNDAFAYKDNYQHSSWLSLISDRMKLVRSLQADDGVLFCSIDGIEYTRLNYCLIDIYGIGNVLEPFIWKRKAGGGDDSEHLAAEHEYIAVAAKISEKLLFSRIEHESTAMTAKYSKVENGRRYYLERLDKTSLTYSESMDYPITAPDGTEVYPPQPNQDRNTTIWRWSKDKVKNQRDELIFKKDEKANEWRIYTRTWEPDQRGVTPRSLLIDKEHGRNRDGTEEIAHILSPKAFKNPKPSRLIKHLLKIGTQSEDVSTIVLDIFAGSGTTGHAVINQNREDGGSRKLILAEMGAHFDTVLKPRIKKVIYSKDWKDGKPVSRQGSSHLFKYIRLESYEDALNNLQLKRTPEQGSLLEQHDKLREQYMLSYMLDVESAGSTSLLNVSAFADPFAYRMNIARGNETKETVVDLVETFNWLLGIKVLRISQKEYRTADFATDAEGRLQIAGRARTCGTGEGWTFQEVEGQTLSGDKVLVIWRTLTDKPEQDNLMLDTWFGKRNYNTLDFEFSRIYVNGDNNLENLKIGEERWKVALIEQEFKKLMFDVEGV